MSIMAAIQMVSGADLAGNLAMAAELLARAADRGVQLAVLPENFALMGRRDGDALALRREGEALVQGRAGERLGDGQPAGGGVQQAAAVVRVRHAVSVL